MGARYKTECYGSAVQAAQAECAGSGGVTDAGVLRCEGVAGTSPDWVLAYTLTPADGSEATAMTVATSYSECDPFETYQDLLIVYAGGVLALTTIWVVKNFILKLVMPQ